MEPQQPADDAPPSSGPESPPEKSDLRMAILVFFGIVLTWLVGAYVVAPLIWKRYEKKHPAIDALPGITQTGDHHPGDPINVALIGSEDDLQHIMLAAGWYPADPITLRSSLKIAIGTVLRREYVDAPVSSLFLFGRKQDLAFEMPVGNDPRRRHHVRFWKSDKVDADGRPAWAGGVTYDERVGFSHTTGQITHHISGDVDQERDHLMKTVKETGDLIGSYFIDGFHKILSGRNGGNDLWHTDGRLSVGTIKPIAEASSKLPEGEIAKEEVPSKE